jgi:hypothetical protein
MHKETQAAQVVKLLSNGEIQSGRGMNQEIGHKWAVDTRWGSHYGTLLNLICYISFSD